MSQDLEEIFARIDARAAAEEANRPPPGMRRCPACTTTLPVAEFYSANRPYCRPCTRAKQRTRYRANGGRDSAYEQLLKREYGLTLAEYQEMVRRQGNRCAICRRPETVRTKATGELRRLAVDHDHATGKVRGLLCNRCNVIVWAIEDNHTTLAAVAAYIESHRDSSDTKGATSG